MQLLQRYTQEAENGLANSFIHNIETSGSKEIFQMHNNTTLNPSQNVSPTRSSESRDQRVNFESVGMVNGENATVYGSTDIPKSEDGQSQTEAQQDYLGNIKNWDWSDNQNQSKMSGPSLKSTEQSVEVVHQENHSPGKKKRQKKKYKGKTISNSLPSTSLECGQISNNALLQNISGNSNSYEASDTSMEKLVNETQKLFDWYQQQIENGEEEHERTNILKVKIIDHYRKLLPWLNFKLAPKFDNSQS